MLEVVERVLMGFIIVMKLTNEIKKLGSFLWEILEIIQTIQNLNCKALQLEIIKSKEVNVGVINSDVRYVYFKLLFEGNAAQVPVVF